MSTAEHTFTSNVVELSNTEITRLGQHLFQTLVLAAEKAVAHLDDPRRFPMPTDPNAVENVLLNRLEKRPSFQQARAKAYFSKRLRLDSRHRRRALGKFSRVNLRSRDPILQQAKQIKPTIQMSADELLTMLPHGPVFTHHEFPVAVNMGIDLPEIPINGMFTETDLTITENPLKRLQHLLDAIKDVDLPEEDNGDEDILEFIKPWSDLHLRIHKTLCIDETDGFLGSEAGDDEIRLGGYLIDPTGNMFKANLLNLGDSFDDGESQTYSPPKIFGTHDLGKMFVKIDGKTVEIGWPRTYYATLILSEADNGGFPEFLDDVLAKLKDWVKGEVIAAIGAAIGTGIGSIGGPLGAAVGAAVGALLGWFLDEMIGFFKAIWEDDVFTAVTVSQQLPLSMPAWGKPHSPKGYVWWKGHGGHYKVWYDWEMVP